MQMQAPASIQTYRVEPVRAKPSQATLALGWVLLWAICLVQAYNGRRWKMPLAGAYAEKFANK